MIEKELSISKVKNGEEKWLPNNCSNNQALSQEKHQEIFLFPYLLLH